MADGPTSADSGITEAPSNIEAEQALLGALLVNNEVYDRVAAILGPEHFYEPVHARIFEVATSRIRKNALASPVTLKAFLEDDEGLQVLGGPAYLARLAGAAISLYAARDYAQLIYDLAIRRDLIRIGQEIAERAVRMEVDDEPREQIVEAEERWTGASRASCGRSPTPPPLLMPRISATAASRASRPDLTISTRCSGACIPPTS